MCLRVLGCTRVDVGLSGSAQVYWGVLECTRVFAGVLALERSFKMLSFKNSIPLSNGILQLFDQKSNFQLCYKIKGKKS